MSTTTTKLKLQGIHYELLAEIRAASTGYTYYKTKFTKEENKAIRELIEAGIVLKMVNRINYQGRFSTKIILSIRAGLNPIED